MDPTILAALLGGTEMAGAAGAGTGMAALLNGGAGAGAADILSPTMTGQLAANTGAPLAVGGADISAPNMTAQLAANPSAGVQPGAISVQPPTSPLDLQTLSALKPQQQQRPQAPSPIAGRGVDAAPQQKAEAIKKIATLAQLLGSR